MISVEVGLDFRVRVGVRVRVRLRIRLRDRDWVISDATNNTTSRSHDQFSSSRGTTRYISISWFLERNENYFETHSLFELFSRNLYFSNCCRQNVG